MHHTKSGAVDVLDLGGPLNKDTVRAFIESVQVHCYGQGQPRAVVNMHEATLLDSSGMEALLDMQDEFERRGGAIKLAAPTPLCRDILRISGLLRDFEVFDTVNRAVGSFAQ